MRRQIDDVEIKEPPIQELKKGRSCFGCTCASGLGCLFLVVGGAAAFFWFTLSPTEEKLKKIPVEFSRAITFYDMDNIEEITFQSGKSRSWKTEMATLVPKAVISPFILAINRAREKKPDNEFTWQNFSRMIRVPAGEFPDVLILKWSDLPANPKFVRDFYLDDLSRRGFAVSDQDNQIFFRKEKTSGEILITDEPSVPGTDFITLTISQPINK